MNLRNLLNDFTTTFLGVQSYPLYYTTHLLNFCGVKIIKIRLNEREKFVERLYDNISWSTVISLYYTNALFQFFSEHNFNL
jgi:hypothetical protein